MKNISNSFLRNISNIPGWTCETKIVVIESDDWGSIRMSSKNSYEKLKQKGLNITGGDSMRYNLFDTIEGAADLELLFETLRLVKDSRGNHPVVTALSLSANPDFEKIRSSNFSDYYYEPFTSTLDKYGRKGTIEAYKEGIKSKLFVPQFHGREHLNLAVWMRALQNKDPYTLAAFEEGVWGFKNNYNARINYQAAFDLELPEDVEGQKKIVAEGLELFEKLHGYRASFFVPPNGPINNVLEQTAAENGIQFMSAPKIQLEALGNGNTRKVYHYLGQQNKSKQIYITRNCFFEPSSDAKDWIASCLSDINIAFRWHKPAVISTHRVNYVGSLDEGNRKKGLEQLKTLLTQIVHKWPAVVFLSSNQLGEMIKASKNY
jgi:hypothetical protein